MRSACIHPVFLRKLVAHLVAEGHDADSLIAPAGFTWEALLARESMVSFDQARLIVLSCIQAAGSPTLGLHTGRAVQLTDLGVLGLLLSCSANLREALSALNRFSPLRSRLWHDLLLYDERGAWVVVEPAFPLGDIKAVIFDHFVAVLSRIFTTISNGPLDTVRLEVPWAPPSWSDAYRALAGTVVFNADRMAFWIPNVTLDRSNPNASRLDYLEAWELCESKLKLIQETRTLSAKLRFLLENTDVDWSNKAAVAARVGVSLSTLFRYLRREGTSFVAVRDEVRQQRAIWYLTYSALPVCEIARMLGYTSDSNFSRAFRRWTGTPPLTFRKSKRLSEHPVTV